uniref:Protein kinase domain-containing protein n=1 Tax=Panagrolaimus sp. JU765 TaxID=591449 RepID=A0AC34QPK4_9BILA
MAAVTNVSSDLIWEVVKNDHCFIKKQVNCRETFSKDPYNLMGINSRMYSGFGNYSGLQLTAKDGEIVANTRNGEQKNHPNKAVTTEFFPRSKRTVRNVTGIVKKQHPGLELAAQLRTAQRVKPLLPRRKLNQLHRVRELESALRHIQHECCCFFVGAETDIKVFHASVNYPLPLAFETTTNSSVESRHLESWNSSGFLTIQIQSLTAQELGYLACICVQCVKPVFDIFELKFETDLTAALIEDSGETHLVVHGYPMDQLTIQIVRLTDNATETEAVSEDKMFFFNDSLIFKYQRDLSHFFAKYFTIFVQECVLFYQRESSSSGDSNPDVVSRKKRRLVFGGDRCFGVAGPGIAGFGFKNTFEAQIAEKRMGTEAESLEKHGSNRGDEHPTGRLLGIVEFELHRPTRGPHRQKLVANQGENRKRRVWRSVPGGLGPNGPHCGGGDEDAVWGPTGLRIGQRSGVAEPTGPSEHRQTVRRLSVGHTDRVGHGNDESRRFEDLRPRTDAEMRQLFAISRAAAANRVAEHFSPSRRRNCLVQGESDAKVCNAAFRKPISVKISDFGMSRRLYSDGEYYKMQNGKTVLPVRWLPPECLSSGKFTHQSDVWSFGMVLFEIFSYGGVPFGDLSNSEVLTAVVSGMKPTLPSSFPEPINNLISQCWRNNPEERITAQEALNRLQIIQ